MTTFKLDFYLVCNWYNHNFILKGLLYRHYCNDSEFRRLRSTGSSGGAI